MLEKIVVLDKAGLNPEAKEKLKNLCKELIIHPDDPKDSAEVLSRLGDADGALLAYGTHIDRAVIEAAPNLKYIGLCCTLYPGKSCNVDLEAAQERGIIVKGVRDYADIGPAEFVVSELIRLLHGFGGKMYKNRPREVTGIRVGIIGAGTTGSLLAKYLGVLGADLYYSDLSRKPELEKAGVKYLPLAELLPTAEVISTHLPRNISLINQKEFACFGDEKIYFNTSVGPTFNIAAMREWLERCPKNFYVCDQVGMGNIAAALSGLDNVIFTNKAAGSSIQCTARLSQKSVQNVMDFLAGK